MYFPHLRRWALIITIIGTTNITKAQLILNSVSTPETISFIDFNATGFSPNPIQGQLNSNTWSINGLSDGDLDFSFLGTTGDYARGISGGGVTTGGVYSFNTGTSNVLGVQSIGSDMTPGEVILKVENGSSTELNSLNITYKLWEYNDQDRSNSISFSYSIDNQTYISVPSLDFF